MGIGETLKSIVGIEGNTKEYLKPMIGYTSANIMLGGAGYPLNLYQARDFFKYCVNLLKGVE